MLSELLPEAKRILYELELKLGEIERGSSIHNIADVDLGLNDMTLRLEALDKLASKETKARRDDAKRRVQHMRISYSHIKTSVDNLLRRKNKDNSYKGQREDLFAGVNLDEYAKNIDLEMAENKSIENSSRMVDGYLAQGQETLSELVNQRERLKSAHKKLFDILNYLGVSNRTMKSIEKRDQIDRLIVFVGMGIVCVVVFLLWWYFKR